MHECIYIYVYKYVYPCVINACIHACSVIFSGLTLSPGKANLMHAL